MTPQAPHQQQHAITRALTGAVFILLVVFLGTLANHVRTGSLRKKVAAKINRPAPLAAHEYADVIDLRERIDRLYWLGSALNVVGLLALLAIIYYINSRLRPLAEQIGKSIKRRDEEIEQRKRAEERALTLVDALKSKNKELDHFAYIASHDLQEPLRTVSNFIELIEEEQGHKFDEDANTYLRFINQATERMRALINKLLRYSQIGREDVSQPVDLNALAEAAIANLDSAIRETSARIEVDRLPTIEGHPVELTQLFQNLLGNAIKFTPPARVPEISVSAQIIKSIVTVDVKDNGIGVDASSREKIFDMFSKIHPSGTFDGYGIGLSFCRRIVELHNGGLELLPRDGRGSTFRFTLDTFVYEKETQPSPPN